MKCYKVTATSGAAGTVLGYRIAGTQADARQTREFLMGKFDVQKKNVTIEDFEVPTAKGPLLDFVNDMAAKQDDKGEDDGE